MYGYADSTHLQLQIDIILPCNVPSFCAACGRRTELAGAWLQRSVVRNEGLRVNTFGTSVLLIVAGAQRDWVRVMNE